ncbi:MAG: aminodeoxychorismate synthase component I [Acidobacteriia bacterium]|nr:aminodeoxychorismate synthase component I [Terriglobia bacterium]
MSPPKLAEHHGNGIDSGLRKQHDFRRHRVECTGLISLPHHYHQFIADSPDSVLLETARLDDAHPCSWFFLHPVEVIRANALNELPRLFEAIERHLQDGLYVAGFLSYECGHHFEPRSNISSRGVMKDPLAWFGVYKGTYVFDHVTGQTTPGLLVDRPSGSAAEQVRAHISDLRLDIDREGYCQQVERIREYIAAGDTYQVNFTTRARFDYEGSPAALFSFLRERQRVPYGAFLHVDQQYILSLSPELFFRIEDGRITTRPMKGTARRGRSLEEDERMRKWLQQDPKNRSENVMIVDLVRSDLGKMAQIGSVQVGELFTVETYDTLLQMTSTISAHLRPDTSFYEIFRALFPCGSVTGAPKCRTMQIIQEIENGPRGVYTGAIGFFAPNRSAVFSVPIRTIVLREGQGEMGVGSGITFDSVAEHEYEECLLKMQFLSQPTPSFQLLESLRWDGEYHFLEDHLQRLESSAQYFGFGFDKDKIRSALDENQDRLAPGSPSKVRLLLDRKGAVSIENVALNAQPSSGTIILSPIRTSSEDRFLYHKTTHREFYDRLHREARSLGHEDVVFVNERGELTEGANNNLFIEIDGQLFTPPVKCGLLAGVYRGRLLASEARASERILTPRLLRAADAIYLCNSVRGLRQVRLAGHLPSAASDLGEVCTSSV